MAKIRPVKTQRCLKTIFLLLRQTFKMTEFYFGDLDLRYRAPEMEFPSFEIEKDCFRDSQGKQIRKENKKNF